MLEPYQPAYTASTTTTTARPITLPHTKLSTGDGGGSGSDGDEGDGDVGPIQKQQLPSTSNNPKQMMVETSKHRLAPILLPLPSSTSVGSNAKESVACERKTNAFPLKPKVKILDTTPDFDGNLVDDDKVPTREPFRGLRPFSSTCTSGSNNSRQYRRASSGTAVGLGIPTYDIGLGSRDEILNSEFGLGMSSRLDVLKDRFGYHHNKYLSGSNKHLSGSKKNVSGSNKHLSGSNNHLSGSNQSINRERIHLLQHRERRLSQQEGPEQQDTFAFRKSQLIGGFSGCDSFLYGKLIPGNSKSASFKSIQGTCITITNAEEEEEEEKEIKGIGCREAGKGVYGHLQNSSEGSAQKTRWNRSESSEDEQCGGYQCGNCAGAGRGRGSGGGAGGSGGRRRGGGGRRGAAKGISKLDCEDQFGLRALQPGMRVRSAVDLVTLVMQEKRWGY